MKFDACPFPVDEAGKMVSEDGTEVTVEGAVEDQEVEKDEDGQEVIKVYIFKADSGEDDMGELQLTFYHFILWDLIMMFHYKIH